MSEMEEGWKRVLGAFEDWIEYEASEFGPWTAYFSLDNLRDLTEEERLGWMHKMYDEVIPGRIDKCREAGVALEDFLPFMPDNEAIETVRSMIDLSIVLQDSMMHLSDIVAQMMEEYREGGLDEIVPLLESLASAEEDIRHHMSLFSKGFGKLRAMGLEIPEEI
ncbi:MAG TPA: hypothetical protein ENG31_04010 [Candidatus Thorarchaeota archaeon]|nr:MAG: hypothetical protein DRO73_11935 [Candidatus Thorarchaeota archaeon]HDD67763.1 hypothetical protein [Candidatus Thorarchaeota archaeon]